MTKAGRVLLCTLAIAGVIATTGVQESMPVSAYYEGAIEVDVTKDNEYFTWDGTALTVLKSGYYADCCYNENYKMYVGAEGHAERVGETLEEVVFYDYFEAGESLYVTPYHSPYIVYSEEDGVMGTVLVTIGVTEEEETPRKVPNAPDFRWDRIREDEEGYYIHFKSVCEPGDADIYEVDIDRKDSSMNWVFYDSMYAPDDCREFEFDYAFHQEGIYKITLRDENLSCSTTTLVVDQSGNVCLQTEPPQDKTAPTVTVNWDKTKIRYGTDLVVTLTADEPCEWNVDDRYYPKATTVEYTVKANGLYKAKAYDGNGNNTKIEFDIQSYIDLFENANPYREDERDVLWSSDKDSINNDNTGSTADTNTGADTDYGDEATPDTGVVNTVVPIAFTALVLGGATSILARKNRKATKKGDLK